jgi:hypothetical protein
MDGHIYIVKEHTLQNLKCFHVVSIVMYLIKGFDDSALIHCLLFLELKTAQMRC